MDRKRLKAFQEVARKSHRVLTFVLIALFILIARIWHLAVVTRDEKAFLALKGRHRSEVISAPRGTIRDRFSQPLAVNAIEYRLSIIWSDIVDHVPRKISEVSKESGEKKNRFVRREYVTALSKFLAREIPSLSPQRIQDIIYSYAIYSQSVPVVLTNGLSEAQFYRLSGQAAQYPGLHLEIGMKRHYPHGKTLSHVIGYTAPIQKEEYEAVLGLKKKLTDAIARYEAHEVGAFEEEDDPLYLLSCDTLKKRLAVVERKLYSLNDNVGRTGVEASFESALRGLHGKRSYEVNGRGDFLKELPNSKEAIPGKRVSLTISLELQKVCEELLVQSESDRSMWLMAQKNRILEGAMNPYIRGGSIVALNPQNGEVLALASIPRYDGNDFISSGISTIPEDSVERIFSRKKREKRNAWLQNDAWLSMVWNGVIPLEKESWDNSQQKIALFKTLLTWGTFLEMIAPSGSSIHTLVSPKTTIGTLISVQKDYFFLKEQTGWSPYEIAEYLLSKEKNMLLDRPKEVVSAFVRLKKYFVNVSSPKEIIACIDVGRLVIRHEELPYKIEEAVHRLNVHQFRALCQMIVYVESYLKEICSLLFKEIPFKKWRKENETLFLQGKRKEEKAEKRINRPYVLYIDKEFERQFSLWWQKNRVAALCYLFSSITGENRTASFLFIDEDRWIESVIKRFTDMLKKESSSACRFITIARIFSKVPESLQKLLCSSSKSLHDLQEYPLQGTYGIIRRFGKPLTLFDLPHVVLSMMSPSIQSHAYMLTNPPGSIFKLVTTSALLHNEEKQNRKLDPSFFTLNDHFFRIHGKAYVGTRKNGEAIPQIYRGGRIPKSLTSSIGQVDLIRAIEYSSNPYFSLAASECLPDPRLLEIEARQFGFGVKTGIQLPFEAAGFVPSDLEKSRTNIYTTAIGQHRLLSTPLQLACMMTPYATHGKRMMPKIASHVIGSTTKECKAGFTSDTDERTQQKIWVLPSKVQGEVELSSEHRNIIFLGMKRVAEKLSKDAKNLKSFLKQRPELYHVFQKQKEYMLAKTSTAESFEVLGLPYGQKPFMYSHTGMGTIFSHEPIKVLGGKVEAHPDIIVIVFLNYGSFGKEAGPIAARVVDEWRAIRAKYP